MRAFSIHEVIVVPSQCENVPADERPSPNSILIDPQLLISLLVLAVLAIGIDLAGVDIFGIDTLADATVPFVVIVGGGYLAFTLSDYVRHRLSES